MEKRVYYTDKLPKVDWLAHAVIAEPFIFVSGQGPRDKSGDIKSQTKQVIEQIKTILEGCGSSLDKVVKITVYLSDMNNYDAMNEVYREYFKSNPPARTCIQAVRIPRDVLVEMEAIALL